MANVVWSAGIDSVSGALSKPGSNPQHSCEKMLLGTHRTAPTTNPNCNRIFMRKKIKRSTPLTQNEIGARNRFKTVLQMIKNRQMDLNKITQDQEAFNAQKNLPNGCITLKKWYWSICGAEYDQDHN